MKAAVRAQRRERARALTRGQSVQYSATGQVVSAGANVLVYHGTVEHAGQAERSVFDDEGLGDVLARAAAGSSDADANADSKSDAGDSTSGPPAPLSVEDAYVTVMEHARKREQDARFKLLVEQQQALLRIRSATAAQLEATADHRHAFRSARLQAAQDAFDKDVADKEAAAKAAADAAEAAAQAEVEAAKAAKKK